MKLEDILPGQTVLVPCKVLDVVHRYGERNPVKIDLPRGFSEPTRWLHVSALDALKPPLPLPDEKERQLLRLLKAGFANDWITNEIAGKLARGMLGP